MPRPARTAPPYLSGLTGLITVCTLSFGWPDAGVTASQTTDFLFFLALVATVMVATEAALNRSLLFTAAGLRLPRRGAFRRGRPLEKTCATLATWGVVVAAVSLADLYRSPPFDTATLLVTGHWPWLVALSLVYVLGVDALMHDPEDALYHAGLCLVTRGRQGNAARLRDYALSIAIKLFFLPLMLGYGLGDWVYFRTEWQAPADFLGLFDSLFRFIFFADVCLGALGYALALRVLNTHVRLVETTLSGWLVCLLCYAPFWQVLQRNFFDFGDDITWVTLTGPSGPWAVLWGSAILGCLVVYLSATLSFGLNFSNLTGRRIICHGPYALVRHPAYLAKNASMWLVQLPFLAASLHDALANTLALLGVGAIYALRAWHEERCLSQDPDYRSYRRWLRRHGLAATLRRRAR